MEWVGGWVGRTLGLCRGRRARSRKWRCSFLRGMAKPLMIEPVWLSGWVGGWVGGGLTCGWIEEKEAVRMSYCELGVERVHGWMKRKQV